MRTHNAFSHIKMQGISLHSILYVNENFLTSVATGRDITLHTHLDVLFFDEIIITHVGVLLLLLRAISDIPAITDVSKFIIKDI